MHVSGFKNQGLEVHFTGLNHFYSTSITRYLDSNDRKCICTVFHNIQNTSKYIIFVSSTKINCNETMKIVQSLHL